MRRYIAITGVVSVGLGAGLGLAACGGDNSPETPIVITDQATTLTKDEFLTQADAICDEANGQIGDIAAAGEGITRASDVADLRQGVITDIRALGTPVDDGSSSASSSSSTTGSATVTTEDTSTFPGAGTASSATSTDSSATSTDSAATATGTGNDLEAFLTALAAEVKAGQKISLASERGEDTAAAEGELVAAKDKAAAAATAYGFEVCGTDSTSSIGSGTSSTGSSEGSSGTVAPSTSAPSTAPSTSGGSSSSGTTTSSSGSDGGSGGVSSGGGGVGPG